jgi:N-acetylmuramoyl-L-alanine amidase
MPRFGHLVRTTLAATLLVVALVESAAAFPTRPVFERSSPEPLRGVVIALDPGHNGGNAANAQRIARKVWIGTIWKPCNQVGTTTNTGLPEHRFNLAVAHAVRTRLERLGATVHMTRTTDDGWGPCVDDRGRFPGYVGATVLVSIHADGAPSSARGFHILRPGMIERWTDDIVTGSSRLANAMLTGMRSVGLPQANYATTTGIQTRTNLGTLNHSDVPAILVECGNMKNASDAARMSTTAGRATYADGIVAGIVAFYERER